MATTASTQFLIRKSGKARERARPSAFSLVSQAAPTGRIIDFYFDTGIVFSGLLRNRAKDQFGAAFGYGKISERSRGADIDAGLPVIRDYEAVLEVNYKAHVMSGWTIAPDFQYFWNPGGRIEDPARPGKAVDDAVVLGVRTSISY